MIKNAYADLPVNKSKAEYTLARWQLDAHAVWQSSGNRFLTLEQAETLNPKTILCMVERILSCCAV